MHLLILPLPSFFLFSTQTDTIGGFTVASNFGSLARMAREDPDYPGNSTGDGHAVNTFDAVGNGGYVVVTVYESDPTGLCEVADDLVSHLPFSELSGLEAADTARTSSHAAGLLTDQGHGWDWAYGPYSASGALNFSATTVGEDELPPVLTMAAPRLNLSRTFSVTFVAAPSLYDEVDPVGSPAGGFSGQRFLIPADDARPLYALGKGVENKRGKENKKASS